MTHLLCGEALYDVFVADETPSGFTLDARIGGSIFNVAVGLARLGRPAALVTGIGTDPLGERLVTELAREGVRTDLVARKDARTTLALVALDASGGARYAFYGEGAADRAVTEADLPSLEGATACVFGCFSLLTRPSGDSFLTLARRARGGPLVALDPNIRPTVEPDMSRWRDRVEAFAACADLIKISDDDMDLLYPGAAEETARRWLAGGTGLVAMTRGAQGVTGWLGETTVSAPAAPCDVVDTVGAGDSFLAALLAALDETGVSRRDAFTGLTAEQATRALGFAARAAALTCARRGADSPRRRELGALP